MIQRSTETGTTTPAISARLIAFLLLVIGLLTVPVILSGQEDLDYRYRGNRYEGVKRKPISAADIEVVSALVDYSEARGKPADQVRLRFYLHAKSSVYVAVTEVDCVYYYRMDRPEPSEPWHSGFNNEFAWQTRDVIRKLKGLTIDKLGAIARLGHELPAKDETVAPIILYYSVPPPRIKGYIFVVRTAAEAHLDASIYTEGGKEVLADQNFDNVLGGRPVAIRCDFSSLPAGRYKLVIRGYLLDNNDPLTKVLHFYHQPFLRQIQ